MIQSEGLLRRLLGPSLKIWLPLVINVIKSLAKSVLIPLGLTEAGSAADSEIYQTILEYRTTILIISNDEMEDLVKLVKFFEGSSWLLKGASKAVQNKAKEKGGS